MRTNISCKIEALSVKELFRRANVDVSTSSGKVDAVSGSDGPTATVSTSSLRRLQRSNHRAKTSDIFSTDLGQFSNKGTGGMESSVALFKPRIHLFACTHPSVSNSLVCNDWLACKHQSTALYQTRLNCGSLLYTSISLHPVFQPVLLWILVCAHASVSSSVCFQHCVSNTFGLWSVSGYKHLPPSSLIKHIWILVPCCVKASVSTRVTNTFGLRLLVCVHAPVPDPCLCTHIRFQPCSNTFDYGCLSSPRRALRGGFRNPRTPGSLRF